MVRMTTLSERNSASSTEWVTKMMVLSLWVMILVSCSCMMFLVCASRAPKGSSIRMTAGCMTSARAIPTRCFIPPESSWILESANFSRPTALMYFRALS